MCEAGGYVLAPPSMHPSGRRYCWSVDSAGKFADAPEWLIESGNARNAGNAPAATPRNSGGLRRSGHEDGHRTRPCDRKLAGLRCANFWIRTSRSASAACSTRLAASSRSAARGGRIVNRVARRESQRRDREGNGDVRTIHGRPRQLAAQNRDGATGRGAATAAGSTRASRSTTSTPTCRCTTTSSRRPREMWPGASVNARIPPICIGVGRGRQAEVHRRLASGSTATSRSSK